MTYGATIAANLNDWLSGLAAGRAAAVKRGAERFASLVSPVSEGETACPVTVEAPMVRLSITSGLHRGASMELTAQEYLIGSGEDCDIVLRDREMAPHHCQLAREWFGFAMRDLRGEKPRPIAPQTVNYQAGEIEAVYDIGGVLLTLRQPPARRETIAEAGARGRSPSWALPAIAVVALVLTAVALANRDVKQRQLPVAARIVAGNQALTAQGFGSTRFRQDVRGEIEIAGLVGDIAERQRLREWLGRANYGDAHVTVQVVSELVEQIQHTLAPEKLQIGLHDGRLRIEGTTPQPAVKDRIHALAEDLKGTIGVDDRVTYVDAHAAAVLPLPVRLRGVKVGNPSYFSTDRGARYFVGGVLPDGSEVLAIDAKQIQFQIAGRIIVYKLE